MAPEPERPENGARTYSTDHFFVFVRTCPPNPEISFALRARSAPNSRTEKSILSKIQTARVSIPTLKSMLGPPKRGDPYQKFKPRGSGPDFPV